MRAFRLVRRCGLPISCRCFPVDMGMPDFIPEPKPTGFQGMSSRWLPSLVLFSSKSFTAPEIAELTVHEVESLYFIGRPPLRSLQSRRYTLSHERCIANHRHVSP
jgi:hypothetical protein